MTISQERRVKVVFDADGTPLKTTVTDIEKTVNKTTKTINEAGQDASKAGGLFGKFGEDVKAGIAMGFGMSTVGMVTSACNMVKQGIVDTIQTTAQFEQSMANVKAITGATGKEFDTLTAFARELGATTMMSAQESADAMAFLGMAGWRTSEMMAGLPAILDLTVASGRDFATVADIVSDNLTAFGLTASDATMYSDALAYAMSNANVNMDTLGESLKYIAPVATSAGVSMQEAVAMTMMLGDAGIKGSQAGTTLRTVMLNLTGANEKATAKLKELGVAVFDSEGKTRSFADIIRDLNKATEGMTDAQKTAIANTLVGKTAVSGFSVLLDQGADKLQAYTDGIHNSSGASAEMAEIMGDTLQGKVKIFESAMQDLQITIGNALLPTLTEGVESLTNFVTWLGQGCPLVQEATVELGAFGASLDVVSEKTSNALTPLEEYGNGILANIGVMEQFGGVGSQTYNQLIADVTNWKDQSLSLINQKESEGLALMQNYSQQYLLASAEEKAELEAKHKEFYENKRQVTSDREAEITQILATAKENNVGLTQEQADRIKQLVSLQQKDMIKTVSDSYSEQTALLNAFSSKQKAVTADTASMIMQKAEETRQATVKSAKERFNQELATANEMRKVGNITNEEYSRMVNSAQDNYSKIVSASDDGFNKVKDKIIKSITEAGGKYNERTGELKDAHGNMVDYMNGTPMETKVKVDTKDAKKSVEDIQTKINNIKGKTVSVKVNTTYTNTTVNRTVEGRSVPTMDTQAMAMARSAVMPINNMSSGNNTINYNGDLVFNNKSDIDYFLKKTARAIDRRY